MEGLLLKTQVLDTLKIGESTLWKLGKKGYLRPRKIGRQTYYLQTELDDFIRNPPVSTAFCTAAELKSKSARSL